MKGLRACFDLLTSKTRKNFIETIKYRWKQPLFWKWVVVDTYKGVFRNEGK